MAKRWSKLKKQIEALFVEGVPLHIQCTAIRTTCKNEGSLAEVLGVFTVYLGKEVIWNFPRQFVDFQTIYPDGGNHYSYGVHDLNVILRQYLDTSKDGLLTKDFTRDFFGITNIFKAADRRLGLVKLQDHFTDSEESAVLQILSARAALTTR